MPSLLSKKNNLPEEPKWQKISTTTKKQIAELLELAEESYLNDWEKEFVISMDVRAKNVSLMTEKMISKIEQVYNGVLERVDCSDLDSGDGADIY